MRARNRSNSTPMTLRAPGWYPDPQVETDGPQRWWDGWSWTDRTREAGSGIAATPSVDASRTVPARQFAQARRNLTWAPIGLAGFSVIGIALVPVMHVIGVAFITLALAAVATGVQALRVRAAGAPISIVPAVLGIVVGVVSALVLTGLLLLSFAARLL